MTSLTDPQGIKDAVNAIFAGGSTHPLADLARLIDCAISDAQFQGLGQFDVARWVAHAINEDQKARLAEFDKTAPHGNFVSNPGNVNPAVGVVPDNSEPPFALSDQALSEVLRPNPSAAARALIDYMGPDAYNALVNKYMTPTTEDLKAPKPLPNLDDVNTPGNHHAANIKYLDVSGLESRILNQEQPRNLWDFLKDLPTLPRAEHFPSLVAEDLLQGRKLTFDPLPKLPPFPKLDLSGIPGMPDEIKATMEDAAEKLRVSMEAAAKAVRKGIDDARAEEARRILAEQPHEHIYGRGSNGLCRICGHESNSRRQRAKRRAIHNEKAKAARQYPQHRKGERVTASAVASDGERVSLQGTIRETVNAEGYVHMVWDETPDVLSIVHVSHLDAPESRLHEALKNKGDGHE